MALCAARMGIRQLYVPAQNAPEATLAQGITVYPVENIAQLVAHLTGDAPIAPRPPGPPAGDPGPCRTLPTSWARKT